VEIADGGIDDRCISPGLRWVLADSYCVRVIDGRLPAVIPDAAANQTTALLPITGQLGVGSYAGVPVFGPGGV
ncbi:diguanylate phosphodiesterase, partial [Mycobacterium sp. ITM-2017-0098]